MTRKVFLLFIGCGFLLSCFCQDDENIKTPAQVRQLLKSATSDNDRAVILLDEAVAYVLKPGSEGPDMDSALQLIQQAGKINNTLHDKHVEAKSLFVSAKVFHDQGDTAAGHEAIGQSISIYKTLMFPAETGEAYLHLSTYLPTFDLNDVDVKRKVFADALPYFKQAGNKKRQADVLKELGDFDVLSRKFGLALNELKESLAIYQSIGYKKLQGIYDLLGITSTSLGDYPDAVEYGLLAAKIAGQQNDSSMQLCTIYSRLATAYANWEKHTESAIYQRKALDIAIHFNDYNAVMVTMTNLCFELVKQEQYSQALALVNATKKYLRLEDDGDSAYLYTCYSMTYTRLKEMNLAGEYVHKIEAILPHIDDRDPRFYSVYSVLVPYYIANHQYEDAEKIARKFLASSKQNSSKPHIAAAYLANFRVDSARGNYKAALGYYQSYKLLSDTIFKETKAFQVAQMQVAMETEKKDNEIKLNQQDIQLLKNKSDIEQAVFHKKNIIRNFIIASTLVIAIILFALFKLKQRRNAVLQLQQNKINSQNKALEKTIFEKNQLLTEKEWLVKEIHHRVKNNLQIIISLLNSQSGYLDNKEAIAAISESRHRMQAMSLIHQKLYQSEDTKSVNMHGYIYELTEYLETSFADKNKISFNLDIDNIELDIAQAIPLGLILNEAITNAIKYAFVPGDNGCISVKMKMGYEHKIDLQVSDNGKGFPENFQPGTNNSLGMLLINGLVKQIGGELHFKNQNGAVMQVSFKPDKDLNYPE